MPRHIWTDAEREILRALYPTYSAAECAAALGLTVEQVNRQAYRLGLRKTREWIAERARERSLQPDHGGRAHLFPRGLTPWNAGKKGWTAGGRSGVTRFRKGEISGRARELLKPVGHEVVRDGQLWRKVTDQHKNKQARFNFKPVSVIVWESANGPIPDGHIVAFRPGCATTVAEHITLDRLELITRAENMRRNTIHNYPAPVKSLMRVVKRAERALKERTNV